MHSLSKHVFAVLLGTALLASCSRPVAYFQPTARDHFATVPATAVPVEAVQVPVSEAVAVPAERVAQANTSFD